MESRWGQGEADFHSALPGVGEDSVKHRLDSPVGLLLGTNTLKFRRRHVRASHKLFSTDFHLVGLCAPIETPRREKTGLPIVDVSRQVLLPLKGVIQRGVHPRDIQIQVVEPEFRHLIDESAVILKSPDAFVHVERKW